MNAKTVEQRLTRDRVALLRILNAEALGAVAKLDPTAAEHAYRVLVRTRDLLDQIERRKSTPVQVSES